MMSLLKLIQVTALLATASLARAESDPQSCSIIRCASPLECVPVDPGCPDGDDCPGTCDYRPCKVMSIPDTRSCRPGSKCRDDPRVWTFPENDVPGICVPNDVPTCGGFAGEECPERLKCFFEEYSDAGICLYE